VHDAAHRAEALANSDPRAACFYARRALEIAVAWVYEHDGTLNLPYREDLSALIHESSFRNLVGQAVFYKCRAIKDLGNHAVHSHKPVTQAEAVAAVRELFHVCYWLARTYAKGAKPDAGTTFNPLALPAAQEGPRQTLAELQELSARLASEREKALAALAERDELDEALKQARAELEAIKKANAATPDSHNYSEAETRDLFIDLLLKEAGWALDKPEDREYEVAGMPNAQNKGFVDYVLWGDDGKPLGVVEAKRTRRDPREGMHQAKLYADCLEAKFGQRPIVFATNGYEHWMWDDAMYPPRAVQGFYKKPELELLIQRRQTRRSLASGKIDEKIVERYYQTRAIRRVGEAFEKDRARRALLVMATGSGKTRTVIALADLLMRANWAKRILFLADRTALVNQAVNAFKRHLPDAAPVNLVTEKNTEGRVYVSTYPTMIGLVDEGKGGERRFGVGHFDLVVIDEAHRSVFMKYGAIFDYFDSLLVGLTATPKDEVGRNTYRLFELEDGVPTDVYSLNEAVADGYLVPARSVSVPLKLPTTGIVYDQLSEEEKEQFELTDWKERAEDVLQDRRVDAPAINQWLFNRDTVDKVLKHLMERGLKVDGGDKLGKTIIFAKNHDHAVFIAERFDKNYPKYAGRFAKVIDFKTEYAQSLIDDFSNPGKLPQIAISVDMLDTGIDVPEVVNLVFFKQVRSKTKFWQMVGRGTRLCPDLFGPGQNKECFYIFDYCGNLDFFGQQMDGTDGASGDSLSKRLFAARLKLLAMLSHAKEGARRVREATARYGAEPETDEQVLASIVELLKAEVGAMNTDNFIVRAKRRLVEKYQNADVWLSLRRREGLGTRARDRRTPERDGTRGRRVQAFRPPDTALAALDPRRNQGLRPHETPGSRDSRSARRVLQHSGDPRPARPHSGIAVRRMVDRGDGPDAGNGATSVARSRQAGGAPPRESGVHRLRRRARRGERDRPARFRGRGRLRAVQGEGAGIPARPPTPRLHSKAAAQRAAHPSRPRRPGASIDRVRGRWLRDSEGLRGGPGAVCSFHCRAGPRGGEALAERLSRRPDAQRDPDRVHQHDRGLPDRTWRDGAATAVRVALHRSQRSRCGRPVRLRGGRFHPEVPVPGARPGYIGGLGCLSNVSQFRESIGDNLSKL